MANNDSNPPNFKECSDIRPGMKREFAMMMKNQSQFISIGRTRSSKSPFNLSPEGLADKKAKIDKKSVSLEERIVLCEEEEPKSGIVDLMSDDDKRSALEEDSKVLNDVEGDSGEVVFDNTYSLRRVTRSLSSRPEGVGGECGVVKEIGDKIVENVVEKCNVLVEKRPMKLKELLETGLLEGLGVRYLRGSKVRTDNGLYGVIRGDGILCYCDQCRGATVVSPNHFELHAGSANKRPPEYLYLENGRTLRDVMNACKDVPLESLTVTIKQAIVSCPAENPIPFVREELEPSSPLQSDMGDRSLLSPTSARPSDRSRNESFSSSRGKGRLTRKDLMMHRKGFDELVEGAEVGYFAGGEKVLEGYKKGSGIFCLCCNSEVSPSQFEAHAGYASRRKPYDFFK